MVHFQGAPPEGAPGVFFKTCLKIDHIWLILFSKSPQGYFFKIPPSSRGRKLPVKHRVWWMQALGSEIPGITP